MPFRELVLLTVLGYISMLQFARSVFIPAQQALKPAIRSEKSIYFSTQTSGDLCASNPCAHEGICIPKGQLAYECKCVGPWHGIDCTVVDACYRSPCRNNGTCSNVGHHYRCNCTKGYYGKNCQHREKHVYKRGIPWVRPYHDVLHHIRQSMIKHDSQSMQRIRNDPRLAYYDPRNGIYF